MAAIAASSNAGPADSEITASSTWPSTPMMIVNTTEPVCPSSEGGNSASTNWSSSGDFVTTPVCCGCASGSSARATGAASKAMTSRALGRSRDIPRPWSVTPITMEGATDEAANKRGPSRVGSFRAA